MFQATATSTVVQFSHYVTPSHALKPRTTSKRSPSQLSSKVPQLFNGTLASPFESSFTLSPRECLRECACGRNAVNGDSCRGCGIVCSIGKPCCVTDIRHFHSAGDLQKACNGREVKKGDTVYSNAASLIWHEPLVKSIATDYLGYSTGYDGTARPIAFQPFAYPSTIVPSYVVATGCKSTSEDYKTRFDLNIGVDVQESDTSPRVLDAVVRFVNDHRITDNLGLAWGGFDGWTLASLTGDGYGRQRFVGSKWDKNLELRGRHHRPSHRQH